MRDIIALCGPSGAGKSTLAKAIAEQRNYVRVPFAMPIKIMLSALLTYQGVDGETINRMLDGDLKKVPTDYFSGHTPQYAMQTLGTEWGRDFIGTYFWTDVWENRVSTRNFDKVVVDDLRFVSEIDTLCTNGSITVARISREVPDSSTHVSETEYLQIDADMALINEGTPEELFDKFNSCYKALHSHENK